MTKRLLFTCLLLLACCRLFAQGGWPDMHVIFRHYNQHKQDTIGVQTLLRLSEIYRKISDPRSLRDSGLLMARQAETLSRHLNYSRGVQQSLYLVGQFYRQTKDLDVIRPLLSQVQDTTRIKLMLDISTDQMSVAVKDERALDSSTHYIQRAMALSDAIHYTPGKVNSLLQLATQYELTFQQHKAYPVIVQAFSISQKAGYLQGMADCYFKAATYISFDSTLYALKERFWEQIMSHYHRLTDHGAILAAQPVIADATNQAALVIGSANNGQYAMLEQLRGIEFAKTCAIPDMGPYWGLIVAYEYKSDMNKALAYALEAVRVTEQSGNKQLDERAYLLLAGVYSYMGKPEEVLVNIHKVMDLLKQKDYIPSIVVLRILAKANDALHLQGNNIPMLLDYVARTPLYDDNEKIYVYQILAVSYMEVGQYDMAEKYGLLDLEIAKKFETPGPRYEAAVILTHIYILAKKYDKATYYGKSVLQDSSQVTIYTRRRAHAYLFMIDTATHNYADAVEHLLAYNLLKDSLYNIAKNKQFEELKVQYETEKKENDIILLTRQNQLQAFTSDQQKLEDKFEQEKKQRSIEQLAFQAERKDKDLSYKEANISLLTKQRQLQDTALIQARWLRNGLVAGAVLLALLLGMTYNRYRIKQKSNRLLEAQQQKINQSNIALQQLNHRQQDLLTEKEWLIKEVHHRVKNNLQLVISLLNMQSHYLKDEFTLQAFATISRRIQAISLIHQKLYQVEDVTKINMRDYVLELLHYLKDGDHGTRGNIRYEVAVEPILLDPAISVPLGLIINEAVSNSLKHAFMDNNAGKITIELKKDADNMHLLIADNGKGMPQAVIQQHKNCMGITLINTLGRQLGAILTWQYHNGCNITMDLKLPASEYAEIVPVA